jgi:hypothetical protein
MFCKFYSRAVQSFDLNFIHDIVKRHITMHLRHISRDSSPTIYQMLLFANHIDLAVDSQWDASRTHGHGVSQRRSGFVTVEL